MIRRALRFLAGIMVLFGLGLLAWWLILMAALHLPWQVSLALLAIGVGAVIGVLVEERK